MEIERLAPALVGDIALLGNRLDESWRATGIDLPERERLQSETPCLLRLQPCFLDRITDLWRYEFGPPYSIGDLVLYGANTWPLVDILARVVVGATCRLTEPDRGAYFARLTVSNLHLSTLNEFQPVLAAKASATISYEKPTGIGERTADWQISLSGGLAILVEVKTRSRDLIELASRVQAGERRPDGTAPAPTHDASILFRSIEDKYPACAPGQRLQGAWITTPLQQDRDALREAYRELDPERVHFAVVGGWNGPELILCKSLAQADVLIGNFGSAEVDVV